MDYTVQDRRAALQIPDPQFHAKTPRWPPAEHARVVFRCWRPAGSTAARALTRQHMHPQLRHPPCAASSGKAASSA